MNNNKDEKFNKVVEIMKRSELDARVQEHLRVFLFSIIDNLEFDHLIELLDSQPAIADKFFHCFGLKRRFLEFGGNQEECDFIIAKEKELIKLLADQK